MPAKKYFVYMLKCANGALYTGYTTDLEKRMGMHNSGKGAKYTRSFGPVELIRTERHRTLSAALKREAAIKKMTLTEKKKLLKKYAPRCV